MGLLIPQRLRDEKSRFNNKGFQGIIPPCGRWEKISQKVRKLDEWRQQYKEKNLHAYSYGPGVRVEKMRDADLLSQLAGPWNELHHMVQI